jgi:Rad3-related DNA helicase
MAECHEERLFTHDTRSRGEAINFLKNNPGRVLVSPSMGTGVDLPYELCEFQIIAKLPFPDKSDPQIAQRMKLGPDGLPLPKGQNWYNAATVAALVQMYGRGMRAEDDACVTYLLDGVWGWFGKATRHLHPEWFAEAIQRERIKDTPPAISVAEQLKKIRGK